MLVLGIDTSGSAVTVGLVDGEGLRGEFTLDVPLRHAESLMPMVDRVMAFAHREPGELGGLGIARGPGYFTALRIGVTAARTLAQALGIPICGVDTLEVMASQVHACGRIVPVLDAARGEVFSAVYTRRDDELVRLSDRLLLGPGKLGDVRELGGAERITVVGAGGRERREAIRSGFRAREREAGLTFLPPLFTPRGAIVAGLARRRLLAGRSDQLFSLVPDYIRPPTTRKGKR